MSTYSTSPNPISNHNQFINTLMRVNPKSILRFYTRTLAYEYSQMRSLSECPFDSMRECRRSTCALESSIFVQCLLYFSLEVMTDKNIFAIF